MGRRVARTVRYQPVCQMAFLVVPRWSIAASLVGTIGHEAEVDGFAVDVACDRMRALPDSYISPIRARTHAGALDFQVSVLLSEVRDSCRLPGMHRYGFATLVV